MQEILKVDPQGKSSEEKVKILREYREQEYQRLMDAAYKRWGWTPEGVPTVEHLTKIGMDLPHVVTEVKKHL